MHIIMYCFNCFPPVFFSFFCLASHFISVYDAVNCLCFPIYCFLQLGWSVWKLIPRKCSPRSTEEFCLSILLQAAKREKMPQQKKVLSLIHNNLTGFCYSDTSLCYVTHFDFVYLHISICFLSSCTGEFTKASDLLRALKKIEVKDTTRAQNSGNGRKRGIPVRLYKRCLRLEREAVHMIID